MWGYPKYKGIPHLPDENIKKKSFSEYKTFSTIAQIVKNMFLKYLIIYLYILFKVT